MPRGNEANFTKHPEELDMQGPSLDWTRIEKGFKDLSKVERLVLELVNKGLQNPEIADRLSNSPGTVAVHIRNILAKLGLNRPSGEALGNERVLLSRVWEQHDRFEQFKDGSGI